jgi:protein-arginine kinase activator protein McsA
MLRDPIEVELVRCKDCKHEFEAFHSDLGTYMCPECFETINTKGVKPIDLYMRTHPPKKDGAKEAR